MKTLRARDVERVRAQDVRPGDVLVEGVVLAVSRDLDGYGYETRFGYVEAAATETVQVLARMETSAVEAIVEAVEEIVREEIR